MKNLHRKVWWEVRENAFHSVDVGRRSKTMVAMRRGPAPTPVRLMKDMLKIDIIKT